MKKRQKERRMEEIGGGAALKGKGETGERKGDRREEESGQERTNRRKMNQTRENKSKTLLEPFAASNQGEERHQRNVKEVKRNEDRMKRKKRIEEWVETQRQ